LAALPTAPVGLRVLPSPAAAHPLRWGARSPLRTRGPWARGAGRAQLPPGQDCHNPCLLAWWVLTALSAPLTAATACAGVTHFTPRLTSKESGSLPTLLELNSLSKCNWRMSWWSAISFFFPPLF